MERYKFYYIVVFLFAFLPINSQGSVIQYVSCLDYDGDTICDAEDNCVQVSNVGQENDDTDSWGNACDNCDDDNNEDQADLDGDGEGDVCDADIDGDGVDNGIDCDPLDSLVNWFEGGPCDDGDDCTFFDIASGCVCTGDVMTVGQVWKHQGTLSTPDTRYNVFEDRMMEENFYDANHPGGPQVVETSTVFEAEVQGGTAPFTYSWIFKVVGFGCDAADGTIDTTYSNQAQVSVQGWLFCSDDNEVGVCAPSGTCCDTHPLFVNNGINYRLGKHILQVRVTDSNGCQAVSVKTWGVALDENSDHSNGTCDFINGNYQCSACIGI